MKKKTADEVPETKTDLKHDTLEFNEVDETTGEEDIDIPDDETVEPEELEGLEADDTDRQAYALDSMETDVQADEDNLPEEDWTDDIDDDDDEV